MLIWAIVFMIWAIRDFIDAEPLSKTKDFIDMETNVRKAYRRRRGLATFFISVVAACSFVVEIVYKISLDFGTACIYLGIPYTVAILYIIYLKRKYHAPGFFTKESKKDNE